jgi:CheY-like chemotaxis protein
VALDHGGLLEVESTPGKGATFRFLLPAAPPGVAPVRTGRKVMPTPVARIRGAHHILIADDEPSVRQLLADVLERAGYRVTAVDSGAAAVGCVRAEPRSFDLAILDVMMHPMDGTEAFHLIREVAPKLPAIFCTGYSDAARVQDPGALRSAPVVAKPFRPHDLVEVVRQALRRKGR